MIDIQVIADEGYSFQLTASLSRILLSWWFLYDITRSRSPGCYCIDGLDGPCDQSRSNGVGDDFRPSCDRHGLIETLHEERPRIVAPGFSQCGVAVKCGNLPDESFGVADGDRDAAFSFRHELRNFPAGI